MKKLSIKSRRMLYTSLALSGLIIFLAIFYFISVDKASISANGQKTLFIIIALAVLAVVGMLFTRTKLMKAAKNLSPEYFKAYEEIADKLAGLPMSTLEQKETLADIIDLFMLAEKNDRDIKDVIGDDINYFIGQIQEAFGYRSQLVHSFLNGIQYTIIYAYMIHIYQYFKCSDLGFFKAKANVSIIALLSFIAFIGIPIITNFLRNDRPIFAVGSAISFLLIYIGIMEVLDNFFIEYPWADYIVNGEIYIFHGPFAIVFSSVLFIVAVLLKKLQRSTSFKYL